jgi:1-acyl-sn-glycerol-3-phosphate acyltransferase
MQKNVEVLMEKAPLFGIGQVTVVREYVQDVFPVLCKRLHIPQSQADTLLQLALETLESASKVMSSSLVSGTVEPTTEARSFWNTMGDLMVSKDSQIFGQENLKAALKYIQQHGKNVLLVQNHRSGADTLVTEILIKRALGKDVAAEWAYIAGHAVNLYLIPLMFTLAMRRFQIFSIKYRSAGLAGTTEGDLARQNTRAMIALRRYCSTGGRLVACYPEGGRGEGSMKLGEPKAACVPQIMHRASDNGLLILPTYVHNAANILPVSRGENEFNEIFVHANCGTASLTIGPPIEWEKIQPKRSAVEQLAATYPGMRARDAEENAYQRLVIDSMLGMVATLAPNDKERGPYAQVQMKQLVSELNWGGMPHASHG